MSRWAVWTAAHDGPDITVHVADTPEEAFDERHPGYRMRTWSVGVGSAHGRQGPEPLQPECYDGFSPAWGCGDHSVIAIDTHLQVLGLLRDLMRWGGHEQGETVTEYFHPEHSLYWEYWPEALRADLPWVR